jgi:hypothetical protein
MGFPETAYRISQSLEVVAMGTQALGDECARAIEQFANDY